MKPALLIVDDEPAIRAIYRKRLTEVGYAATEAGSIAEARAALAAESWDGMLLDLKLPDGSGLDWLPEVRAERPDLAIVIITGAGDIPLAVEAMRRGADHFLTKPVDMAELEVFLAKTLELGSLRRTALSRERLHPAAEPYFGPSPAMAEVRTLLTTGAASDAPFLLLGETGTGKGMYARWVHARSTRRTAPFVEVNCSLLRGELLASELFGHAKGAYTSAHESRSGLLDLAHRGTLFLDEIGDMDAGIQAQFLKIVEEKSYRRLGETTLRRSDFRLLAATNHAVEEDVRAGRFRADLFYRLSVLLVRIPPLRERAEDLPGLLDHIRATLGAADRPLPPDVLERLARYPWPGNIREVRNVIERALLLAGDGPLSASHFPGLDPCPRARADSGAEELVPLDQAEARHIRRALKSTGGDVTKAAEALGLSRATLYRKLKQHGLDVRTRGRDGDNAGQQNLKV